MKVRTAAGERTLVAGDSVTIGRDPSADLAIDDPRVSRMHARVASSNGSWVVEDLNSRNGTYLDGNPITALTVSSVVHLALGEPGGPWLEIEPVSIEAPSPPPATDRAAIPGPGGVIRIGRSPDNDLMIDDLLVSRHHAEVRRSERGLEIIDLDSHNGTYVNGQRIRVAPLDPGDVVAVGPLRLIVTPTSLEAPRKEEVAYAYAAAGLRVLTKQGNRILDDISFALRDASLLGIIGPSGSGKSTLLGALTGLRPATDGGVFIQGRDFYAHYGELRQMVGFVPQDDVLFAELTVGQTLDYAAELRFPPDVSESDRSSRVNEVLEELGLTERRNLPIAKLSGGQRKRVSVALELLTRPAVLILDEPTSGLDPGFERSLMELLQQLAKGGRTVVVVTHATQSLDLCDRVLCMATGGRLAWFGPPGRLTSYFGRDDYQQVFRDLGSVGGEVWQQRFLENEDYRDYVAQPLANYSAASGHRELPPVPRLSWFRQVSVLVRRNIAGLVADRKTPAILIGLAVLLGLVLLAANPPEQFSPVALPRIRILSEAGLVIWILVIAVTQLGHITAIREIVKELPLFKRERAVGLSISAYVTSKAAVLSVITILQAVILTVIATARQDGPVDAVVLGWPLGELIVVMVLTGLAAMAIGLAVSAWVSSPDRAMNMLTALLIVQMVLSAGGVNPKMLDAPVLKQAAYLGSAQWGFTAAASTVGLNQLAQLNNLIKTDPVIDLSRPDRIIESLETNPGGNSRYNHTPRAWFGAVIALLAIIFASLVITGLLLRRYDAG